MKNILLLFSIICICSQSISQNECSEEIPNGSFENWKENSPINWATTNIADKIADMQGVNYNFKNISQSPGFKGSALHLKNVSLADLYEQMNPEAWAKMPAQLKDQIRNSAFSGSATSCQGDCESALLSGNGSSFQRNLFFPLQSQPQAICGIVDDQKLGINIFMEGILELTSNWNCTHPTGGRGKGDIIAHEIAHLFGGEHEDNFLMDRKSNYFGAKTIAKIRRCKHP